MVTAIGPIDKSSPSTRFYLNVDILSQSTVTNQSVVRITIQSWNIGNTSSNYGGSGQQIGYWWNGGAYITGPVHSGTPFLPGGYANGQLRWSDIYDLTLTHDANGYWLGGTTFSVAMGLIYGSINESHYGSITIPRIPRVPGKPAAPTLVGGSSTTTGWNYNFFNPASDGGSTVTTFNHQIATDTGFTNIVSSFNDPLSPANVTGMTPGTTYYVRYRAQNAVGSGPWSDTLTVTTLPAVAPGMLVVPDLSGLSAVVTLSPPGGVIGVTKYNIEYRILGTTTPNVTDTVTTTKTVTGLLPGTTYEWRSNAEIGGYTSPWTNWVAIPQPSPNTNPGQFFDGNTTDTAETIFAWSGTTNNSTSTATGFGVQGWLTFAQGVSDATGTGVVGWVSGGIYGTHMARVTIFRSFTDGGLIAGVGFGGAAEVEENTLYYGSIHIQLHRVSGAPQRMQAGLRYYDGAGVVVGSTWADSVMVIDSQYNPGWVRLTAQGVVPFGATRAAVVVRDVNSGGGSPWNGGDAFYLDAAMVSLGQLFPYFDGSFASTSLYDYNWDGVANQSISERLELPQTNADPLADPDCPPIPLPPVPPTVPSDCIVEVGLWRRYTVVVPASEVGLWSSTLPSLTMTTDSEAERQVRIRVYPNPTGVGPDAIDTTNWDAELILTYIPPNTVMTLDSVTQRVWASVDGGPLVSGNHLLYGTGGTPPTWPELRCGIGYVFTLDVPLEAPSGNLTPGLALTQRM